MIKSPLSTPILLLIYNRPDTTEKVFNEIRKARPTKLFIAADGPKTGDKTELNKCKITREIIKQIDWKCQLFTLFRKENLGLKKAVSSAIDWFFTKEEWGVILEDDCVPTKSFFYFCQELLEKYKNDTKIMMISGSSSNYNQNSGDASYYFSKLASIWGWATWRRAWRYYDSNPKDFSSFVSQHQIKNIFSDRICQEFWLKKMEESFNGGQSWAFAWAYSLLKQNGLCICSNVKLITNIGWGSDASNSKQRSKFMNNFKTGEIKQIFHPLFIIPDNEADRQGTLQAAKTQMPTLFLSGKIKHKLIPFFVNKIPFNFRQKIKRIIIKLV